MKRRGLVSCMQLVVVILFAGTPAMAADWRFPLGLSYASGFEDVVDIYDDNLEAEGYSVDKSEGPPVGISFHPYVEFDNGLGVGASIGPSMIIYGDTDFLDVPVGLDGRYTFIPGAGISPYVRVGVRTHLASGDYVEGTTPGFFGAIGLEFLRDRRVSIGVEISTDASEVELERVQHNDTEDVQPCELMVSVFVVF